jgi:myo-inositol-hexaphosphate 3-phosphohydrolase
MPLMTAPLLLFCSWQWFDVIAACGDDVTSLSPTLQLVAPDTQDQDDMCVWIHPNDATQSTIIASDKSADQVVVYSLEGDVLQSVKLPKPGNIDVRQNIKFNGESMDLVVVNQRTDGFKLIIFGSCPIKAAADSSPTSGTHRISTSANSLLKERLIPTGSGSTRETWDRSFQTVCSPAIPIAVRAACC